MKIHNSLKIKRKLSVGKNKYIAESYVEDKMISKLLKCVFTEYKKFHTQLLRSGKGIHKATNIFKICFMAAV